MERGEIQRARQEDDIARILGHVEAVGALDAEQQSVGVLERRRQRPDREAQQFARIERVVDRREELEDAPVLSHRALPSD